VKRILRMFTNVYPKVILDAKSGIIFKIIQYIYQLKIMPDKIINCEGRGTKFMKPQYLRLHIQQLLFSSFLVMYLPSIPSKSKFSGKSK